MKIRFIKVYGFNNVGDVIEPAQQDIARILIMRGVAVRVEDGKDLDQDGKAEGGIFGIKKAFSAPPISKKHKR